MSISLEFHKKNRNFLAFYALAYAPKPDESDQKKEKIWKLCIIFCMESTRFTVNEIQNNTEKKWNSQRRGCMRTAADAVASLKFRSFLLHRHHRRPWSSAFVSFVGRLQLAHDYDNMYHRDATMSTLKVNSVLHGTISIKSVSVCTTTWRIVSRRNIILIFSEFCRAVDSTFSLFLFNC